MLRDENRALSNRVEFLARALRHAALADTPGLCEHGISFAPGVADEAGRSQWCGECFPEDEREHSVRVEP
jgi:hypothetical protein